MTRLAAVQVAVRKGVRHINLHTMSSISGQFVMITETLNATYP